ncbi:peroxiredoxin [Arthrobacter mobilis]|uniref:Alkyl hydroperoxide reductase E n=1 Tax=Arthrobacter mobilis TaxID=2724944 RepID=A0A7X6QMH0_9MICC|nr:peroxiredoxin [Arthrobacter mobilis]NKX56465.1 peroxiredoxin [Arthrobacter mobilis]
MTLPLAGRPAPDFELSNQFGEPIRLSELRGGNVVVVFYPFAFSGICTGELCALRDDLGVFRDENARVLAVSVDHKFALRAFAEQEGYEFDLLADFWPHGGVAKEYGVFDEASGMAGRGTFIIDAEGILRHIIQSPRGQARDLQEYHRILKGL